MKYLTNKKSQTLLVLLIGLSTPVFAARPGAFNNQLELFYVAVVVALLVAVNFKQVVQFVKKKVGKVSR